MKAALTPTEMGSNGINHNELDADFRPGDKPPVVQHDNIRSSQVAKDSDNETKTMTVTDQLIANLGHDIYDVRLRALKCLWRKVDCGLLQPESVVRDPNFFQRLAEWITTHPCNGDEEFEEGFELMLRLCCKLAECEEFRGTFRKKHLDSVLSKRRLECTNELRGFINTLLDTIGSFYLQFEGPPDDWKTNQSAPLPLSASSFAFDKMAYKSFDYGDKRYDFDDKRYDFDDKRYDFDDKRYDQSPPYEDLYNANLKTQEDVYSQDEAAKVKIPQLVEIPSVQLSTSDRRVLTSTVESLASKNEKLILMTCCFVRDVLLNDFPAEVFVQEVAVATSLVQVAQDSWADDWINQTAYQSLWKLGILLRTRIHQMNTTDLWTQKVDSTGVKGPQGYYGEGYSVSASELTTSSSAYFAANLCKILRMLSRSILYDSNRITRWILLEVFLATFVKCTRNFSNVQTKNVMMLVQEVLYDLKTSDSYSSAYSSRPLAPFQPIDDSEVLQSDFLLDSLAYSYQTRIKGSTWDTTDKCLIDLLHDVQNSTGHKGVMDALTRIKEHCFVIVMKTVRSQKDQAEPKGLQERTSSPAETKLFEDPNWRDAFYRFLSVEPTSDEDEVLLCRVLEIFTFILFNLEESIALVDWLVPLCGLSGCATLRLLSQYCFEATEETGGTNMVSLTRSLLDFYEMLRFRGNTYEKDGLSLHWSLLHHYNQSLKSLEEKAFVSSAVTFAVVRELCHLTASESVLAKLLTEPTISRSLLASISRLVMTFAERFTPGSFRNEGIIRFGALILLHLTSHLKQSLKDGTTEDWIADAAHVTTFLWSCDDTETKAAGLQISGILTSTPQGSAALVTEGVHVTGVWRSVYKHLINSEDAPLVKHGAALTILGLLNHVYLTSNETLPATGTQYVNDMLALMVKINWYERLNRLNSDPEATEPLQKNTAFITPNVMSLLCKIYTALSTVLGSRNDQKELYNDMKIAVINSGLASQLFRLVNNHEILKEGNVSPRHWTRACACISAVIETLVVMCEQDNNVAVILIGDKKSVSSLVQMLRVESPNIPKTSELMIMAGVTVLGLLSCLCVNSGKNFHDLERNLWSSWTTIFSKLSMWLQNSAPAKCRQVALKFSNCFLFKLAQNNDPKDDLKLHHTLCMKSCTSTQRSFGSTWLELLMNIWKQSTSATERNTVIQTMLLLLSVSPDSKEYANQNAFLKHLSSQVRRIGVTLNDSSDCQYTVKKVEKFREETMNILSASSLLMYQSKTARETALSANFPDNLHKIFKLVILSADRNCFHVMLEWLLNFTEEFPKGAHALTLTSNVVGVVQRKTASPQSLLYEIISVLQHELEEVDKHPNLKTVDLCLLLLRNSSLSAECRAAIIKSSVLHFIRRLHVKETKRWGQKQNHIKLQFLDFLLHISINADIQALFPRINEALEILLILSEEGEPVSILALQIIRNLSFHASNRPRFLCNSNFIPALARRLRISSSPDEIESITVTLWAIVANSEKGKTCAKQCSCVPYLKEAMQRLDQMQQDSNDIFQSSKDFSQLKALLSKVSRILGENR